MFGAIGAIPGVILSLAGWVISGSPEEWGNGLWISCYMPFFGCVAIGLVVGWRSDSAGLEG